MRSPHEPIPAAEAMAGAADLVAHARADLLALATLIERTPATKSLMSLELALRVAAAIRLVVAAGPDGAR